MDQISVNSSKSSLGNSRPASQGYRVKPRTKEVGEEEEKERLFKSSNLSIEFMSTVLVDAAHHPIRELYSVHVGEDFR